MRDNYTNESFLELVKETEDKLENLYLKEIENAFDKAYAEDHFQSMLFTQNELVPYQSIFFSELLYTYEHYRRILGPDKAYEAAFSSLDKIKEVSSIAIQNAQLYEKGDTSVVLYSTYARFIRQGEFTISELLLFEEGVLKFTVENLTSSLALHVAGENLMEKFTDDEPELGSIEDSKGSYTLNERRLALYFLLKSLGFKQGQNEDRTALASLYHLILDRNFSENTKVKNSNIYKSLGLAPDVVKHPSKLKGYLKSIRPFFQNANMHAAVDLIDEHIQLED